MTRLLFVLFFTCSIFLFQTNGHAQPESPSETSKTKKPYKILTSGKQITVKTNRNIKKIMVWTSTGHRVIEEQGMNTSSYSFRITVPEKIFFVMLHLEDGKTYSEKIGLGN